MFPILSWLVLGLQQNRLKCNVQLHVDVLMRLRLVPCFPRKVIDLILNCICYVVKEATMSLH